MSEVSGQHALWREGEPAPRSRRLPSHSLSDLLLPVSIALDLAEGRTPGHAQRVAYIALSLGEALGLEVQERLACCYAGLVHDIGVIDAGAGLAAYTRRDERLIFASHPLLSPEEAASGMGESQEVIADRIADHVIHGARAAQSLGLPPEAIKGISGHHEHWDGSGYPYGLSGDGIPVIGRVVGLADQLEAMINQTEPLMARRNAGVWLSRLFGREGDPRLVDVCRALTADDHFWLGLYSTNLSAEISAMCGGLREARSPRVLPFSENMSRLLDSRFSFAVGVSERVAAAAEALGEAVGLPGPRLRRLRIASLLHDIGQLSVPERIMAKPGILTVEELDVLRLHPIYSKEVVRNIPGMEEIAEWVVAHHERYDGKGYPDGRSGAEIPLEARILAVADAYVAMTSDRPHRPRLNELEAKRRLGSAAGSQLDPALVDAFLQRVGP